MDVRRAGTTWIGLTLAFVAACGAAAEEPWDVHSDTWVATDALGRHLPLHEDVGAPRAGKFVAAFYFLWLGQHGDLGPFDISKILAQDPSAINNPASPLWGPLHVPHHWGESIFGYYRSDDEGVLRKHAQMLADAGVDAVIFDVTNQLAYPQSWRALGRAFDQVRRDGNHVPQIAFLCPFGEPRKVVRELWEELYSQNFYPDLWFRWEGKPLILADPASLSEHFVVATHETPAALTVGHTLGQAFTTDKPFTAVGGSFPTWAAKDSALTLSLYRGGSGEDAAPAERLATERFENVADNAWRMLEVRPALPPGQYYLEASHPKGQIGWWSVGRDALPGGTAFVDGSPAVGDRTLKIRLADDRDDRIREFFTFRKPQPDYFVGPTGPGQWSWLEVYPQHAFYKTPGVPEQVAVGAAQNAVDGKLGVLSHPRSYGRSFHDGRQPEPAGQDTSGRNFAEQWKRALQLDPALIFVTGWNEWIAGRFDSNAPFAGSGPVTFVDTFKPEYSRDVEPMQGGHGDNYYYQLIANIRRFQGARPLPAVVRQPIAIDGRFDDWRKVLPEFRDTLGDPVQRDHPGWAKDSRYVNRTGRNDIVAAKVSYDDRNVYFYVRTRQPLTSSNDPNWMLLLIDGDGNSSNGWLGYDFIVNRQSVKTDSTFLERHQGPEYRWGSPVTIPSQSAGNELELAIPRDALGATKLPAVIDFKWADNIQQTGQWSDFTLHGDAAPNDRYNYRAKLEP